MKTKVNTMDTSKVNDALRAIGLALSASHNVIASDQPDLEPDNTTWRTNHIKELESLRYLEDVLASNTDTCPLCGSHNNDLLTKQK